MAGFPIDLGPWLEIRFRGLVVKAVQRGAEALRDLAEGDWSLLLVSDTLTEPEVSEVLARLRAMPDRKGLPVLACLDKDVDKLLLLRLINQLQVNQLLFHPLDRQELARQVSSLLDLPLTPPKVDLPASQLQVATSMAEIWSRFKDATLNRVGVIEEVTAALLRGALTIEQRRQAEREAHKLAGSLGTFGFHEGSRLAREIDRFMQPGEELTPESGLRLSELLVQLRQEVSQEPRTGEEAGASGTTRLLIVDDDRELAELLAAEARLRGFEVQSSANLGEARGAIAPRRPDVVLLDLTLSDSAADGRLLMAELAALSPPVPVVVFTGQDALIDRIEVARLGGAAFLQKPQTPANVLDVVRRVLKRHDPETSKVLAVDDDPTILKTLESLLAPRGIQVTAISDPLLFWQALEDTQPDLLVLDIDMPFLSGIELCRVIRNDVHWNELPVLFLTARTDVDTMQRVYSSGADDYVTKPIVGPELLTRISNRLERNQILRRLADTDVLTGVATRHKATQVMEHFLRLAKRQDQPVSVAVIDLDHFKPINDRYGHPTGDRVLRRVGELLLRSLRGEDVVARWGGEEFVIGAYGSSKEDSIRRLSGILADISQEEMQGPVGEVFRVSFSAGVAQYPADGMDLNALYMAADEALYKAKSGGRNQIVPCA